MKKPGCLARMRVAELLPEGGGHVADGVDAEGVAAFVDPLLVGADHVVEHGGVLVVVVGQLRQVVVGVIEAVQRVAHGVELVRGEVLLVGDQRAVLVEDLPELRLLHRHGEGGRAVVDHDVLHHLQPVLVHGGGELAVVQVLARQVLVHLVEVDAPVAVEAGLAAVGELGAPAHRVAAGEGLVRVVDDGGDPHRAEAHALDVVGVVQHALEVAAEVADVRALALGCAAHRDVPGGVCAALVAVVVARCRR